MRRGLLCIGLVGSVLAAMLVVSTVPAGSTGSAGVNAGVNPVVDGMQSRYLSTRPTVGPTWVVNIASASASEQLMMRTLQGIVNRTQARLYLIDGGDQGAQHWLDEYQSRGLVTIAGTTDIAGALAKFAGAATGYVLASEAEPWTIDVAATIASVKGAVVATAAQVPELQAAGLTQVADTVGQWPDEATAYTALAATYRSQMAFPGIAVLTEGDSLYDFTVQQGILTIYARPDDPDWPQMAAIIAGTPAGHAVYGYLSSTGDEEAIAVAALSQDGLFLVPTDTTRNLSYQIAVGAGLARARMPAPDTTDVAACSASTVNVVVGITDGDNLNIPLSHYAAGDDWQSPSRGQLPIGWSVGPSLAELAPAAWDTYAEEATPDDELVGAIGYGYASPALLPDPEAFYADSFSLMSALGMSSFWSLAGGLETPSAPGWTDLDTAAGTGMPHSVLVEYGNSSGVGSDSYSPAGRPAFTSGTDYADTPTQLAAEVKALEAMPAASRPLVSFLSASVWSNPVDQLVAALKPLEADGVRFLTPAQAAACVPPAPPVAPPTPTPGACLPHDPYVLGGLKLVAGAIEGELKRIPTAIALPLQVSATPSVAAGGVIHYHLATTVDLQPLAAELLADRTKPLIAASYGAPLAATATLGLDFSDITLHIPLADGTRALALPTASTTGATVQARWGTVGSAPALDVEIGPLSVNAATPSPAFAVTADWAATAAGRAAPWKADIVDGGSTVDLTVKVGVTLGTTPINGSVEAPWTCTPTAAVLASTAVAAAPPTPVTVTEPARPDPTTTTTSVPGAGGSTTTTTTTPGPTVAIPPTAPHSVPPASVPPSSVPSGPVALPATPVVAPATFTG